MSQDNIPLPTLSQSLEFIQDNNASQDKGIGIMPLSMEDSSELLDNDSKNSQGTMESSQMFDLEE